ncbi:hypothetical protein ON010_g617 [Phytophthora cinnamomi]|nr:hypothetical protein ON010_g617 [Phytophthora cinnamomi]
MDERVEGQCAKQVARQLKHPKFKPKTKEELRRELEKYADITPRELCVFIGLLIARSIVPNKEKLAHHWRTTDEGAIPRGCFGQFLVRDRFMHLSCNLHFSSNHSVCAASDRAWKLRPVIDALQDRFSAGFIPPAVMAFDEAMLPSRSTFNHMLVYMKDKPHKWGTKLFMLCLYCDKKESGGVSSSTDYKLGPAAVVRNLRDVFGPSPPANGAMRLVVTDRFYSAVPLAMQSLTMGFYSIGTKNKKKPPKIPMNRPTSIERGTYVVADALYIPDTRVMCWWYTRAVHMLSTGGSVTMDRIVRRDKVTGEQQDVACPRIVKDSQTYMGGVDVHDQMRLQSRGSGAGLKQRTSLYRTTNGARGTISRGGRDAHEPRVQAAEHVKETSVMAGVPLREGVAHVQPVCYVMFRHLAQGLVEWHVPAQEGGERRIRARTPERSGNENGNEEKDSGGSVQSSSDESTTDGPHLAKRARVAPDTAMTDCR